MKAAKPIDGTFTLTFACVTSAPLRFNASRKKINQVWDELIEEMDAVQAIRAKRRKKR